MSRIHKLNPTRYDYRFHVITRSEDGGWVATAEGDDETLHIGSVDDCVEAIDGVMDDTESCEP